MGKELNQVKNKIGKLLSKKALIDEELEPLFIREKELEDQEIVIICRKNNISLEDLMDKVNRDKQERLERKKEMENKKELEKELENEKETRIENEEIKFGK